jgi:predicted secreted Zn-dependent protease
MPITLKKGATSTTTYTVKGDTLAGVNAQIDKSGPKDLNDGKRYSGLCRCEATLDSGSTKTDQSATQNGDEYDVEMWIKEGTMNYTCTITMPKLGANKLSKAAKDEWDRFLGAVTTHENGHIDSYENELKAVNKEIESLRGNGNGDTEKAATKAALDDLKTQLGKFNLTDRLNKNAAAYDKKTGHGKTQKAVLDTSIT